MSWEVPGECGYAVPEESGLHSETSYFETTPPTTNNNNNNSKTCVQVSFGDGQSFRCSADQLGAAGRRAARKSPLARVIETVCLWQGDYSEGSPAHSIHHTALKGAAGLLRADWHPCSVAPLILWAVSVPSRLPTILTSSSIPEKVWFALSRE